MAKRDWVKKSKHQTKKFDWILLLLVMGLTLFGVLMVYNASVVEAFRVFGDKYYYLKNQLLWMLLGFIMMFIMSKINYHWLKRISGPLFLLNLILLIIVLIPGIGMEIKGARRWLNLGIFILQPSELIKLTLCLYLGSWLEEGRRVGHFFALIVLVAILIGLEPDMGTLAVIVGTAFLVYFLSGKNIFYLIILGIISILSAVLMIFTSSYRKSRLQTFLDPTRDPLGSSYHIRQVLISLGTGGFLGLGLGQSRQKYQFLPEATTDSIFAIIAEETGFIGALFVIIIFIMIIIKGFKISRRAPDKFGQILAGGISGWIGIQALINLAAMAALVPLTGLPLPFISYGGSSLIVTLAGIGILLNISLF